MINKSDTVTLEVTTHMNVLKEASGPWNRDSGNFTTTGLTHKAAFDVSLQPFLPPVPPQGSETPLSLLKPLFFLLGAVRTLFALLLVLIYAVLVHGVCSLLVKQA